MTDQPEAMEEEFPDPGPESYDLDFDPNGPPQARLPATAIGTHWGKLPIAACFIAAGGVVMGMLEATSRPCYGATRSARLKWEERQAQIDEALQHDAEFEHGGHAAD
jgi:hypothetical protein